MDLTIRGELSEFLRNSAYIDFEERGVRNKAEELKASSLDEIDLIDRAFRFVRDEIKHSWDAQDKRATAKASEALREGVGICWAKSNLLAALLRANNIPVGICYQKLPFRKSEKHSFCIHALNAVYIPSLKIWRRVDVRGNKAGVDAQFDIEKEKLAFPVRAEEGAIDYKIVYPEQPELLMNILKNGKDMLEIYLNDLPEEL